MIKSPIISAIKQPIKSVIGADGGDSNPQFPLFSGGNVDTEKVSLNSTITFDATSSSRWRFWVQSSGAWNQGSALGFGVFGGTGAALFITDAAFVFFDNSSNQLNVSVSLNADQLYHIEVQFDGVNITVNDITDGVTQLAQESIGSLSLIGINTIGQGRGREAEGLLCEVYFNNTGNNTTWTASYSGLNEDWNDGVGSNDGTGGVDLIYVKNTQWANQI